MTTAADTSAADHLRATGVRIDDSPTSERPGVHWILSGPSGSARSYDVLVRAGLTTAAAALLDARPDRPLLLVADHVPDPATAGAPLRVTAPCSGVPLGTVQGVVKSLGHKGHLEVVEGRRQRSSTGGYNR